MNHFVAIGSEQLAEAMAVLHGQQPGEATPPAAVPLRSEAPAFAATAGGAHDYFLILCQAARQPAYRALLAERPYEVRFVDSPELLLAHCVAHPPLGLLVDMLTSARMGPELLVATLNLGVTWPVMRVTLIDEQEARVLCFDPPCAGELLESLDEIAAGDPAWKHGTHHRRFVRLMLNSRVRFRSTTSEVWQRANSLNVSTGGVFLLTLEPPPVGERIELEILDLTAQPERMFGTVVHVNTWADAPDDLPGVGVRLELEGVSEELRQALVRPEHLARRATLRNG